MSDPDTTPVGNASQALPDHDAMLATYDFLDASLRQTNKATLFTALAAIGVSHVTVAFDGSGDSGQIETVEARAGDTPVALPDTMVRIGAARWGQCEPVERDVQVSELIENLVYDYLADTHAGWENGDGAYGEFVFDVAAATITLDHNDRYVAVESSSHTF